MANPFRKKKTATGQVGGHDKATGKMAGAWSFVQTKWAKCMGRRTENLSRRKLLLLLMAFIALAGGNSIFLIRRSVSGNQANTVSVTPVKIPKYVSKIGEAVPQPDKAIGKDVYQRIVHFREYMDSLAQSPEGQAVYDSIVANRPGLLDSIGFIEKIYQPQIKN
jgi:hypothetical protein